MVNFVEGKFLLLVKEWMKVICIVIVRYWRVKGKILVKDDNGKKVFYYEGCCMLRFLEVNKIVVEEFDWIKGFGVKKLVRCLRYNFVGISWDKI